VSERASEQLASASPVARSPAAVHAPHVDVVDSTWIGVAPSVVAPLVADASQWSQWWPDLDLRASEYRGVKGVRWLVRSAQRGRFAGSMEIWLEPVADGVVAHYFLRLDAKGEPPSARDCERLVHHYRTQTKQAMWSLSDRVDPGRIARVTAP
jgi:hypothetical protein